MKPDLPQIESYWYLATPYSKYPGGIEEAWRAACVFAGELIRHGIPVYSPIAETHPIAIHSGINPYSHDIWLPADKPKMDAAGGLIVAKLAGWQDSYGIAEEIKAFTKAGKPIVYLVELP